MINTAQKIFQMNMNKHHDFSAIIIWIKTMTHGKPATCKLEQDCWSGGSMISKVGSPSQVEMPSLFHWPLRPPSTLTPRQQNNKNYRKFGREPLMSVSEMCLKINMISLEPWKNNLWSNWSCCTADINPFNPLPPPHQSFSLITQCDDDVWFCFETCFILTRKCPQPWGVRFIYHLFREH